MANMAFDSYKYMADRLLKENGVNYSDKNPAVAAWMFDTYLQATENKDEDMRSKCASGLMLRYWSVFTTKKVGIEVDYDTKISYGWEGLEYAMKYKVWQNPARKVNADQAAKQSIHTIFLQHNYNMNLDKDKANYGYTSLDDEIGDSHSDDARTTLGDTLVDEYDLEVRRQAEGTENARNMIQLCINKKKLVEAIILDTIAFNDAQRQTKQSVVVDTPEGKKKRTETFSEFWSFRCIQLLNELPDTYPEYFCSTYIVNPNEFTAALEAIKAAKNPKLYKFLDKTLSSARTLFSY